jgi:pimeloyl-ACP methyl ester carboxylesterase
MGALEVVCLPGFAEPLVGERWVADLAEACGPAVTVTAVDWPGLWSRWDEPVSFDRLVDAARAAAESGAVLVGHSLGGRVALQVAATAAAAGVVALCSPAVLGIDRGPSAQRWRSTGLRPTERVAPNGMRVSFDLPVPFLDELEVTLEEPSVPACPTLLVAGELDDMAPSSGWVPVPRLGAEPEVVSVAGCGHRFMADEVHRAAAVAAVAGFIARLHAT